MENIGGKLKLKKKQWDDQAAIDDIENGGQEGATYLFNKYGGRLLNFFEKQFDQFSGEDAKDVLQNTFVRFINSVRDDKYQQKASVYTYLSKIGSRECIRFLEKMGPQTVPINDDEDDENFEPIPSSVNLERELCYRLCVAKALKKFENEVKNASDCLQVLTLKGEGWSIEETAKKIGRNPGATREFLSQCRKKLEPYMQPCLDDCDQL